MPPITPPSRAAPRAKPPPTQLLSSGQKGFLALAALLIGPSILKKVWEKPVSEVDLSAFNIVTKYDTPAIERRDSTLRIEFCAS